MWGVLTNPNRLFANPYSHSTYHLVGTLTARQVTVSVTPSSSYVSAYSLPSPDWRA